ncbi:hypothetical protein NECAME_07626 [Necator americanus]|uniref:G-protein coupled receptors family 1 profile domain-containing protein n=1 Tax=Necator americanus TaxID=51031 RepID=W2TPP8_NECAM|nr:hypothetical protein NECAME_07626 [Necator americanus]ETN82972.1 hypothetical protein NECAME_07626 [Necator americanus]
MIFSSTCAGILMIVVSFIGLVPLLLVVLQILRYRRNFTPFRYLILSKLIADGLELFIVMMLLVSSELIFGEWVPLRYRPAVGYVAVGLQYSSFHTSIAMTANRLLAVLYPLKYNAWFTVPTTITMIIICWLSGWIIRLDYMLWDCHFIFVPQSRQFIYTGCTGIIPFIYNVIFALLTTTLDIFSLSRVKHINQGGVDTRGSKHEKPWFLQATINSALYLSMLGLFYIAGYSDDKTVKFFLRVIGWQLWLSAIPLTCLILIFADIHYHRPSKGVPAPHSKNMEENCWTFKNDSSHLATEVFLKFQAS